MPPHMDCPEAFWTEASNNYKCESQESVIGCFFSIDNTDAVPRSALLSTSLFSPKLALPITDTIKLFFKAYASLSTLI